MDEAPVVALQGLHLRDAGLLEATGKQAVAMAAQLIFNQQFQKLGIGEMWWIASWLRWAVSPLSPARRYGSQALYEPVDTPAAFVVGSVDTLAHFDCCFGS